MTEPVLFHATLCFLYHVYTVHARIFVPPNQSKPTVGPTAPKPYITDLRFLSGIHSLIMVKFLLGTSFQKRFACAEDQNNNAQEQLEFKPQATIARPESNYSTLQSYLFDGTLYKIIQIDESEKNPKIKAQCSHCLKIISGTQTSTGNFLSHFKKVHPSLQHMVKAHRDQYRQQLAFRKIPNTFEASSSINTAPASLFSSIPELKNEELQEVTNDILNNTLSDATSSTALSLEDSSLRIQESCKRKRVQDTSDTDKMMDQALQILQSSASAMNDSYFTYALNIAHELRKYDAQTLAYVKRGIANVLFEADIGRIPSYPTTFGTHPPQVYVSSSQAFKPGSTNSAMPNTGSSSAPQHTLRFSASENLPHELAQQSLDELEFQIKIEPTVIVTNNTEPS